MNVEESNNNQLINLESTQRINDTAFGNNNFTKNWAELSYKYKYENFLCKTMAKIKELLELDYGDNAINAWNDIREHKYLNKENKFDQVVDFKKECEPLFNSLENIDKISVRIQILS